MHLAACRVWNGPTPVDLPALPRHAPRSVGRRPVAAADRQWYRINNQAGSDTAEVWIYDEIGYWGVTAGDFINELKAITQPKIDLHLNTPGGDVFDGIAIYNALLTHPAAVTVKIDALAASAGSFIAMAGDRIVAARNSQVMIHEASGLSIGAAEDMRQMADLLDRFSENIAGIYNDRAGGGVKSWRTAMQAETWYSASEAVEAGLADEVAPLPERQESEAAAAAASWDLSVFRHPGREAAPAPVIARHTAPDKPPVDEQPVEPVDLGDFDYDPADARGALADAVTDCFEFDPDVFRAALELEANNAPAPPVIEAPPPEPPTHIGIDQLTDALLEALQ